MNIDMNFIYKLTNIPWFKNCGSGLSLPNVVSVKSAKEVITAITSTRWENIMLDQEGDFTAQLSIRACHGLGNEYQEWNTLVDEFKEEYLPQLQVQWKSVLDQYDLDVKEVIDDVSFHVLFLAMADAYKEILPFPEFFLQLLSIYEKGFLPCGWKGKKPTGSFLAF